MSSASAFVGGRRYGSTFIRRRNMNCLENSRFSSKICNQNTLQLLMDCYNIFVAKTGKRGSLGI
jgi:hypothetical protein